MIVVTGEIVARTDKVDEVLRLALEHVKRSRTEPGCVSHNVYVDPENPRRMFFYEQWADEVALKAHFQVPASQQFVRALQSLVETSSGVQICRSEPLKL